LQMAFVEVSRHVEGGGATAAPEAQSAPASEAPAGEASAKAEPSIETPAAEKTEEESKKRFTKSYGP